MIEAIAITVTGLGLTTFGLNKLAKTSKFQLLGDFATHVSTEEKVVALTYDDGPNPPYTEKLLEVLDRHQVKATFFVVGKEAEQYPDTLKAMIAQGHELGNHSYSHAALIWKRPKFVWSEIQKTDQLLRNLGVTQPIQFRSPFGFKLFVLPYLLSKLGKTNILWNVDPRDFEATDSQPIVDHVLANVKPGSIILLHDGGRECLPTIAATEKLIQTLHAQGYRFKTVSELLQVAS